MTWRDRVQRAVACACKIVRGKIDPAKMTYAKLALVKRALGAKVASTRKTTVSTMNDGALMAMVRVMPVSVQESRVQSAKRTTSLRP